MDQLDLDASFWGDEGLTEFSPDSSSVSWKGAFELASKLIALRDQDGLTSQFMDGLVRLTGAERVFFLLREGEVARILAGRNLNGRDIGNSLSELSWNVANRVLRTGKRVVTVNAIRDARFSASDSVYNLGSKSICCIPIKSPSGETAGAIYLDNRTANNAFTEPQVEILQAFCDLAGQSLIGALEDG